MIRSFPYGRNLSFKVLMTFCVTIVRRANYNREYYCERYASPRQVKGRLGLFGYTCGVGIQSSLHELHTTAWSGQQVLQPAEDQIFPYKDVLACVVLIVAFHLVMSDPWGMSCCQSKSGHSCAMWNSEEHRCYLLRFQHKFHQGRHLFCYVTAV